MSATIAPAPAAAASAAELPPLKMDTLTPQITFSDWEKVHEAAFNLSFSPTLNKEHGDFYIEYSDSFLRKIEPVHARDYPNFPSDLKAQIIALKDLVTPIILHAADRKKTYHFKGVLVWGSDATSLAKELEKIKPADSGGCCTIS